MKPLIVLAGPTAVGKTELALKLAQCLNAEIISADSMQIYKYMDIGTAKPSPEERQLAPHHLIDIIDPDHDFSVADYQKLFENVLASIYQRGKLPLMVGGTGLYIRACIRAFDFEPGGPLPAYRQELNLQAEKHGLDYLHSRLALLDPITASRVHPNDKRRIIRALEVYQNTGVSISKLHQNRNDSFKYKTVYLFLNRDREELYRRIEIRVDQMIQQGLINEVELLLEKGYAPELKPMQSLGYKQINKFLRKEVSLEEAVVSIKQETRRYAKRQLTWFRREPIDYFINISDEASQFFGEILNYIEGRFNKDVE